jgi:hypothetical protein
MSGRVWSRIVKSESKYGERDKSYTILGVELTEVINPYIWYLGANLKQIIVRINQRCIDS